MYTPLPLDSRQSPSRSYPQQQPIFQQTPLLLPQGYGALPKNYQVSSNGVRTVGPQPILFPPGAQPYPSYFMPPNYFTQPMPILRRDPRQSDPSNLASESKIIQNKIYCVLCNSGYLDTEKDEHIKKHIRKSNLSPLKKDIAQKLNSYHKESKEIKKAYIVKPIVQPEEHNVLYEPTVYNLVKEVEYLDDSDVERCERGIGNEGNSFSFYDNNVTLNSNALNYIPDRLIQTEPNPFVASPSPLPLHPYQGEDINSPSKRSQKNQAQQSRISQGQPSHIAQVQQPVIWQVQPPRVSQVQQSGSSKIQKPTVLVEPELSDGRGNLNKTKPLTIDVPTNKLPEQINNSISSVSPERVSSAFKKKPQRMSNSMGYVDTGKVNASLKKDNVQPVIVTEPVASSFSQEVPPVQQSKTSSVGQVSNQSGSSSSKPVQRQSQATPPAVAFQDATFNRESFSHDFTKFVPEENNSRGPVDQLQSFSGPIEIKGPLNKQSKKQSQNIAEILKQFAGSEPLETVQRKRLPNRVEW